MPQTHFSCFLIGADTLLIECAEILLREGHEVCGVITSAPRITDWCAERDIRAIDTDGDYPSALAEDPFDYLFAITHLAIIPDEVLELPRKLAINFHDGPLPRYAGLNTPVWALLNQEPEYGISWHIMTSGVDRGDLLKQEIFEIAPTETALSLNTKCMAAAVDTFPELISELAGGREERTAQDASLRSYFGKFKRPAAACSIDWVKPANEIEAFVRALNFGPYPNPVGSAKACLDEPSSRPFVVTSVDVLGGGDPPSAMPGTVTDASAEGIEVATGDGVLVIREARSLRGGDLSPVDLSELGLAAGMRLALPDQLAQQLTQLDSELCRSEAFWSERLERAEPPDVPQASSASGGDADWHRMDLEVPGALRAQFGDQAAAAALLAFCTYLVRTGRKEGFHLALADESAQQTFEGVEAFYSASVPFEVSLDPSWTIEESIEAMSAELVLVRKKKGFLRDLVLREPTLAGRTEWTDDAILPVGVALTSTETGSGSPPGSLLSLVLSSDGSQAQLVVDRTRIPDPDAESIRDSLSACLLGLAEGASTRWTELPLVSEEIGRRQLKEWNDTTTSYDSDQCVHQAFEAQVDLTPDATALVFEGTSVTYRELDERANSLARHLQRHGVGPDALVGVNVERSVDLLVATLGVMKAGGAYVPLDPDFPEDRIALMIEDSGARILITQSSLESDLPGTSAHIIRLDSDWDEITAEGTERPISDVFASNLAYAIYTSGSTGRPKGVLIEHRNVGNFFTGMDAVVQHDPPGVWLAVTSLSFDISVLELFWTLARGFKVVIFADSAHKVANAGDAAFNPSVTSRSMDFGLFMWGNDDGPGPSKYRLMLEGAKFFDQNGFDSVWTPERHFHAFGGPFPNPSVTGAAIAAVTERLNIRSGSCVSPLHHPIRVAEEWAVVDNLCDGRVGLSFAAGWQPNDFVIRPESYPDQKQVMIEQIDTVRRLWRGETVEFENPLGQMVGISTLPRPVQPELPFWITTAGNPESYRIAGSMGANVLTHLLGQSLEEVAGKIAIYRQAREEAGLDPAEGNVTLMLHTFVGKDDDEVREIVRQPMKDYLGASMKLVLGFAWTFPAFKRPGGPDSTPDELDLSSLSDEDTDAILDFAFDRYFETSGLFGTPETCGRMVNQCKAADIDEIACLLDFGVDTDLVMGSLPGLKVVRDRANRTTPEAAEGEDYSFAAQVHRQGVTHLQCTPSMARLLVADPDSRGALGEVQHLMIGGEAFPAPLAAELTDSGTESVTNMYGPTETTIWSSTQPVEGTPDTIPIGRPIANTQLYILDRYKQPLPLGVPGELYIGGDGVTRGYHNRPELTAERFVSDPFRGDDARMYWTGDLAQFRADGVVDFLGRVDHQVKIRGYRIELGEIEAALDTQPGVRMSAVLLREDEPGDQRLVAYVLAEPGGEDEESLRGRLREVLPEYMVPGHFVSLDRMPLTPNGKIDRKALPEPASFKPTATAHVEPANELERTVAQCWQSTLRVEQVGVEDNFFDIGGHSLLVVQLHREISGAVDHSVSLVDLYRFPTVRSLTEHLAADGPSEVLQQSEDRAERRKAVLGRRRGRRA